MQEIEGEKMQEQISDLMYYFMQYRRVSDTSQFSKLMHNSDLCPMIKTKTENVVQKFSRYRSITYDIQGFKDEGTDILVRLTHEDSTKYICFQIKSNDDLKEKEYLSKIKAQALDSQNSYYNNLLDYYILVCCDVTSDNIKNSNMNKLRQIEAAFSKVNNIHIIEPSYVLGFLNMSSLQMDVAIKNKLDDEDIVIKLAMDIVMDLTPTERALIYYFISQRIYCDDTLSLIKDVYYNNFIEKVYEKSPDYDRNWFFMDEERINEIKLDDDYGYQKDLYKRRNKDIKERIIYDLDFLSESFIQYKESSKITINLTTVLPIATLMLDGSIRYDYNQGQTLDYIMNLLGGMKGFNDFEQ